MVDKTNLQVIAQDYFTLMIKQTTGMKTIIFDSETKIMFSLIISKSFAIKEEIFIFEDIKNIKSQQECGTKGIFFIRPTEENINLLTNILKEPMFADIFINFTNICAEELIKILAYADDFAAIKVVNELFMDYYILNSKLFHLNINQNLLMRPINIWRNPDHMAVERITEGIFSACLSLRLYPVIKFIKNNEISSLVANKVLNYLQNNSDLINKNCGATPNGILLIYDRKEDPITPLLTQWTYQSMIHDHYTIENNVVKVKGDKLVLSDYEDEFFKNNIDKEFGEVASLINDKVAELGNKKENEKMETFEEIKKYIEALPQKKKESMEITKHTTIIYDLTKNMEEKKLLEISSLEQEVACNDNKKEQMNKILNIIKNNSLSKSKFEKVKLFLLFCLRYEEDTINIEALKNAMKENNMGDYCNIADLLLKYCGSKQRNCDLLGNKDFISKHLNKITSAFKDIPNIFTQHTSLLSNLVKKMNEKKCNEIETLNGNSKQDKFSKMLIFNLGGATYEEARDMNTFSRQTKIDVVYGGTNMINSRDFITLLEENVK